MVSTLIPIWFHMLMTDAGLGDSYLSIWGYATSITTIVVAILGPICGTITDYKGFRKPMFVGVLLIGVIGTLALGISPNWIFFIITYVIAKICYQVSLVFYDSMLPDVTTNERMDNVSAQGYAWGYIGSCIPFIGCLLLYVLGDMTHSIPVRIAMFAGFAVTAVWWLCVSLPLIKNYKQKSYVNQSGHGVRDTFVRLGTTLKDIAVNQKQVLFFLIGFFFYIDGVYTIIDEAVAFGTDMGLNQIGLLIILLATQVVTFAFASLFGRLSRKYNSILLISIYIGGYTFVTIFILFTHSLWQFGIMAFIVGMFQGAIQALSRSYYGKIIPPEKAGEYFGIYDICGKGAAFMGTMLVGVVKQITRQTNIAVSTLIVLFIFGFFFLRLSAKTNETVKTAVAE